MVRIFLGLVGIFCAGTSGAATADYTFYTNRIPDAIEVPHLPVTAESLIALLAETYHNADVFITGPSASVLAGQVWLLMLWVIAVIWLMPNFAAYARWLASLARSRTRSIMARRPLDRWADR